MSNSATPAQYTGGEWNSVVKSLETVDVSFAFAFPDTYAIGMSHLGMQVLYDILNRQAWLACERVFSPWPDMEGQMREHNIPLFSLESRRNIRDFDIVGFSLQHELCCTTVLNMLDLAGIPVHARDRTDDHPLVIAGGPVCFNPAPMAPFIDAFVIGDGERAALDIAEKVRGVSDRTKLIESLVSIEGVYVPSLDNRPVRRSTVDLTDYPAPTNPIVPYVKTIHERYTVEIMRGCVRGCRFCHAGMTARPMRYRTQDDIVEACAEGYRNTGYNEIGLCSLSSGDYPGMTKLMIRLFDHFEGKYVNVSLPSLRITEELGELAAILSRVRKPGLTLAPEAGSERLRRVINKPISDDDFLEGVQKACELGWDTIKLYFMVGFPGETEEDIQAVISLVNEVARRMKSTRRGRAKLNVTISPFVPKPHTPFQWESMADRRYLEDTIRTIRSGIKGRYIKIKSHDPVRSVLEAVLARGDERIADVIERAWQLGCRLDEWDDWFDAGKWGRAFEETGVDPDKHRRERDPDEELPWDFIDAGISRDWLIGERERAHGAEITPDCLTGKCSMCGACK